MDGHNRREVHADPCAFAIAARVQHQFDPMAFSHSGDDGKPDPAVIGGVFLG
jgi:hypothetical protein